MTDIQKAKNKAKKALSPVARMIIDRYEEKISGHEDYLSDRMKYAELAAAMHFTMVMAYPHNPGESIGVYIEAMPEAREYLGI